MTLFSDFCCFLFQNTPLSFPQKAWNPLTFWTRFNFSWRIRKKKIIFVMRPSNLLFFIDKCENRPRAGGVIFPEILLHEFNPSSFFPTRWRGTSCPIEIKIFCLEILAENSWKIAQTMRKDTRNRLQQLLGSKLTGIRSYRQPTVNPKTQNSKTPLFGRQRTFFLTTRRKTVFCR